MKTFLKKNRIALGITGGYFIVRGTMYSPYFNHTPDAFGIEILQEDITIWAWVGLWVAVGITAIIAAIAGRTHTAWALVVSLLAAWGIAYSFGIINSIMTASPFEIIDLEMTASYLSMAAVLFLLNRGRFDHATILYHNDTDTDSNDN